MALERFSPPGNLTELSEAERGAWSARVAGLLAEFSDLPQVFDPLKDEAGAAPAVEHAVVWPASPGRLVSPGGSDVERWEKADSSRDEQDEYCEWAVERSGNEISRITFTTETPDYFEQLLKSDHDQLCALYGQLTGKTPASVDELTNAKGELDWGNAFNRPSGGGIAHLSQGSNNLFAAVALVAQATVLREKEGARVTEKKALVRCGALGDPLRNSDPQIAIAINQLAAQGEEISLADPPGLYIDSLITAGMTTPDGTDAVDFWEVTRGDEGHGLRAKFEVPADRGYSVSGIEIDGEPIRFGAQLADRVRIRVVALSRPGGHKPVPQPCKARE
jgi:hypothetical protein